MATMTTEMISTSPTVDKTMIQSFRQQIHGVGGLFIFFGLLSISVAYWSQNDPSVLKAAGVDSSDGSLLAIALCIQGGVAIALGVLTCMKKMWSVYVALVLCYLYAALAAFNFNVIPVGVALIAIVQTHRVIKWANQMRSAGISLTVVPK